MPNIYLQVHFKEKERVKSLGARWDNEVKKWYVPHGLDLTNFNKWLPDEALENNIIITSEQSAESKGITLSQLLQKVTNAIQNIEPQLMWVRAEVSETNMISNFNHPQIMKTAISPSLHYLSNNNC